MSGYSCVIGACAAPNLCFESLEIGDGLSMFNFPTIVLCTVVTGGDVGGSRLHPIPGHTAM